MRNSDLFKITADKVTLHQYSCEMIFLCFLLEVELIIEKVYIYLNQLVQIPLNVYICTYEYFLQQNRS